MPLTNSSNTGRSYEAVIIDIVHTSLGRLMASRKGGCRSTPPRTPASYWWVLVSRRYVMQSESTYAMHYERRSAHDLQEPVERTALEFRKDAHLEIIGSRTSLVALGKLRDLSNETDCSSLLSNVSNHQLYTPGYLLPHSRLVGEDSWLCSGPPLFACISCMKLGKVCGVDPKNPTETVI